MTFTWPIDRTGLPALPAPEAPEYAAKVVEQRAAAQLAVTVMHALSGRQFGLYEHTVRPCRQPIHQDWRGYAPGGVTSYILSWEGDRWVNWSCGCLGACKDTGPNVVHLPGPVHDVVEVKLGDTVLNPLVWTLENDRLYRRDAPWPTQDLNRPLGDVNTWSVRYNRGIVPPEGVAELTGILAKEMLSALDDEGRCRLPRTVTTASRQGVTYRAYDPAAIYGAGKTGIPEIDLWLSVVNPNHLMAAPSVL